MEEMSCSDLNTALTCQRQGRMVTCGRALLHHLFVRRWWGVPVAPCCLLTRCVKGWSACLGGKVSYSLRYTNLLRSTETNLHTVSLHERHDVENIEHS